MFSSKFELVKIVKSASHFINRCEIWVGYFDTKQVLLAFCNYNHNLYNDELFKSEFIYLPKFIITSVNKRKAEYLAGRFTAKKALDCYPFFKGDSSYIESDAMRAPVWPDNISGSISHSRSKAISVVGCRKKLIGVDIERIIDVKDLSVMIGNIYSKTELRLLTRKGLTNTLSATLIFSVKESLFKAVSPVVKDYFGFEKASIDSIDTKNKKINVRLDEDFAYKYKLPTQFTCYFEVLEHQVLTLIIE